MKLVTEEDFRAYAKSNPFMEYNHISIVSVSPDRCVVKVDLAPESKNRNGYAHGGLLYAMADCVAGIAARCDGNDYVTQSAHVNFLRNTKQGVVYALARVVRRGRHMVVLHVAIRDAEDRLLADCAVDMMRMET